MLKLESSELNSNPNSKISLEIKLLEKTKSWQDYEIIFHKGKESYHFKSQKKKLTTYTGDSKAEIGKFAFAITPVNEIQKMRQLLNNFLEKKTLHFIFQPIDPSFEFKIERIPGTEDEFKIYFWVDAGNTNQLEYTWDAIGIRFLTSKEKLINFSKIMDQLAQ